MKHQPDSSLTLPVDGSPAGSVNYDLSQIGSRIKAARNALGLTQEALASMAGATSKRGLQDNEAGKNMPGGQMIFALVVAGVNANWILTGDGDMLRSSKPPPMATVLHVNEQRPQYTVPVVDSLLLQQVIDFFYRWLDDNKHNIRLERRRHGAVIAVLYRIAAQSGKVVDAEMEQVLGMAA